MTESLRPVGLGLAGRGEVSVAVGYARQAASGGLDSVWFHETYFERDAITYAAAVAGGVGEVRVGLGALNPNTRHPVLTAMTMSALDEMAPGRMLLALGTALPLRLAQLQIPYQPEAAIRKVEEAIDDLRALWRGDRLPTPDGLPDIEPMFPPLHPVQIWVAGYRRAFHELAGRRADGFLARPAESLAALRVGVARIEEARRQAGRPQGSVEVGGYLLALADRSRRLALDRAKREPFVIYMLSVQSDQALRRAGFDPEMRRAISAAWRSEDYHRAAQLIPDQLVDAFLLCGTPEEIAAGADRYRQAGMTLPILQPVLQEDQQVEAVIRAATLYSSARSTAGAAAEPTPLRVAGGGAPGLGRRARGWLEIARPFSLTAAAIPVSAAGGLALAQHLMNWPLFLLALAGGILLQVGTNVINEIYDVRQGVDSITSPRASRALVTGRVGEGAAFWLAGLAFALATAIGAYLITVRGWELLLLGLLGGVGGGGYTAPPLQYKYRAAGLPLVFVLMGPLMVLGGYFAITGFWSPTAAVVSIPIGLLVTAILHGNEWRDIGEDARAGISTVSIRAGRRSAHALYVGLLVGAYMALALGVAFSAVPPLSLLAILSLPLFVRALRASELGAAGQQRAIAMIDLQTAQLHMAFGALLVVGLAATAVWRPGG
ncbi:MAG: LLM class flavin-dependent oxidoreductase [Candidatus Dormibacteria bacterium]